MRCSAGRVLMLLLLLIAVAGPVATMARGLTEADELLEEPPVELDTTSGSSSGLQVGVGTGGDVRPLPLLHHHRFLKCCLCTHEGLPVHLPPPPSYA